MPAGPEARGGATLAGGAALLLWSTLALLAVLLSALPPFEIMAAGFGVAGLFAMIRWLVRGDDILARLRQPAGAWALGVGGLFGYHFCYFLALRSAPAVQANLINYLWPLLIVLFSGLLPGHRLGPRHLVAAVTGFAGAILLIAGDGLGAVTGEHWPGYALALACAVIWSGYSVANRRFAEVPTDAVGGFCILVALLALLCHLAFEEPVMPSPGEALMLVLAGLGPVGAAFFLWDHGTKRGDLRLLGFLAYATPLASTLLLVLVGRSEASWTVFPAALLIVGGAVLGSWGARAS